MFVIASDEQWVEIEGAGLGFTQDPAILVPCPKKFQDFPVFRGIFFRQSYPATYERLCLTHACANHSVCITRGNIEALLSNAVFNTAQLYL